MGARRKSKIGAVASSLVVVLAVQTGCGQDSTRSPLLPGGERQAKAPRQTHPRPFLDFPEDKARKAEEENPETAFPGIVTMTAVQPSDYAAYRQFKEDGQVVKEERREGMVLFAVEKSLHVPISHEYSAFVVVTERYRSPIPAER